MTASLPFNAVDLGASPQRPDEAVGAGPEGDAASIQALSRLTKDLARVGRAPSVKDRKKAIEKLRGAVEAIRVHDFVGGAGLALQALELDEASGVAWHVLAICREKSGDFAQAIAAYEAALRFIERDTDVCQDLGRLAQRLGQHQIAEKLFLKYLAVNPGDIEVTNNLACLQRDQHRYDEAIETLRGLIVIEPQSPVLWNTLGTVLTDRGDMQGSLVFFDEALRLDAEFSKALYNRANARMALGDPRDALTDINAALDQVDEPFEVATMKLSKALVQMIVGDLHEAFETYEARFAPQLENAVHFLIEAPRWTPDQPLEGRSLTVFGEQGLGDEILFSNVLPDVAEALGPDGKLTLIVEQRLVPLYRRSYPDARVFPHRTVRYEGKMLRAADLPDDEPAPDFWAPVASLWRVFRTSQAAFPDRRAFLTPDPARVAHWKAVITQAGLGPTVGVVWKSLKLDGMRKRYFSPFDLWKPVLTTPGITFVNLQYGDVSAEMAEAEKLGLKLWTPPGIDLKDDLDDVAALTCALDLLIGPPNASTNLGAACGAPWWAITTPDAWPMFGTGAYPTYPSARVFPIDGFGDWEGVMQRLSAALRLWGPKTA